MEFSNKIVLVTGGTSGIGLATAFKFHELGARVILVGRDLEKMNEIKSYNKENLFIQNTDVTKVSEIKKLRNWVLNEFGKIDIIINAAGIGRFGSIGEIIEDDYELVMNTNFKGTFFIINEFTSLMNEGSSILLFSSYLTDKTIPFTSLLTASKAAIESLTKSLAYELAEKGIRVNAISPGSIKTNFMQAAKISADLQSKLVENFPKIPLGKRGNTDQVVNAVVFLASERADYISGSVLKVDGGIALT